MSNGYATFEDFMAAVDKALVEKCGLSHLDLIDWEYHDAFEDGLSIEVVVEEVLEENDHPDFR